MDKETPDANALPASSTESNDGVVKPGTTPEGQALSTPTFSSVAKDAFDKASKVLEGSPVQNLDKTEGEGDVEPPEPSKPEGDDELPPDGEDAPEKESVEDDEQPVKPEGEEEAVADKDLPFHNHPRFKELVTEKNDLQTKVKDFETKLQEAEPAVNNQRYHNEFCQEHGITPESVRDSMNFLAYVNADPATALKMIEPLYKQLQEKAGTSLPQDLVDRVNKGEIDEHIAKEMWELRRGKAAAVQPTRSPEQRQAVLQNRIDTSVNQWDQTKRSSDLAFKPKASVNAPDGLWELTNLYYVNGTVSNPPTTPQAAVLILEAAYKRAKAIYGQQIKPTRPTVRSSRSSNPPLSKPKTYDDVTAQVARQHGISYQRPTAQED